MKKDISEEKYEAQFYLFNLVWALENIKEVNFDYHFNEAKKYMDKISKKPWKVADNINYPSFVAGLIAGFGLGGLIIYGLVRSL